MVSVAATAHKTRDASLVTAERCWSWKACPFGCQFVDDCALLTPLPVHGTDQQAARTAA
jgi:hypothetical protein